MNAQDLALDSYGESTVSMLAHAEQEPLAEVFYGSEAAMAAASGRRLGSASTVSSAAAACTGSTATGACIQRPLTCLVLGSSLAFSLNWVVRSFEPRPCAQPLRPC